MKTWNHYRQRWVLWRKGTEVWWAAAVGGHRPGKSAWRRGRRFETERTEIIVMGKLWKEHCRQKEEQVQKPSNEEGSDTSKKMKEARDWSTGVKEERGMICSWGGRWGTAPLDLCSRASQGRSVLCCSCGCCSCSWWWHGRRCIGLQFKPELK